MRLLYSEGDVKIVGRESTGYVAEGLAPVNLTEA
jgi:hypothetical protein